MLAGRETIMTTYKEVAEHIGLTGDVKERYLKYMKARWGEPEDESIKCRVGYAEEWALRFKDGDEFNCSDAEGQQILMEMI